MVIEETVYPFKMMEPFLYDEFQVLSIKIVQIYIIVSSSEVWNGLGNRHVITIRFNGFIVNNADPKAFLMRIVGLAEYSGNYSILSSNALSFSKKGHHKLLRQAYRIKLPRLKVKFKNDFFYSFGDSQLC